MQAASSGLNTDHASTALCVMQVSVSTLRVVSECSDEVTNMEQLSGAAAAVAAAAAGNGSYTNTCSLLSC